MLLRNLLILAIFICVTVSAKPKTNEPLICEKDDTCYSEPRDCKMLDCLLLISFSGNGTKIVAADYDGVEYFVIYVEVNGKRQDQVFFCFGKNDKCFHAEELRGQPMVTLGAEKVKTEVLNRGRNQYIYTFNRVIFDAGDNITYSFRKGYAGQRIVDPDSEPLYHMAKTSKSRNVKAKSTWQALSSSPESADNYDALERNMVEDSRLKRLARRQKNSRDTTASFNDVWRSTDDDS